MVFKHFFEKIIFELSKSITKVGILMKFVQFSVNITRDFSLFLTLLNNK